MEAHLSKALANRHIGIISCDLMEKVVYVFCDDKIVLFLLQGSNLKFFIVIVATVY